MIFVVRPYAGAGDLRFGMTMNEIRQTMNLPHESFKKSSTSKMPTDSFMSDSVHVYYKDPGVCEAIEFYGDVEVLLESRKLLGISYSEVKSLVATFDDELEEDGAGFTSLKMGIGIYAPSCIEWPDGPTESVIVFAKGYYD